MSDCSSDCSTLGHAWRSIRRPHVVIVSRVGPGANLCGGVVMLGSASTTPPTDGAFAEYVVVPARQCYALPESMSDGDAAMLEPLGVALHAIRRAGPIAGTRVLVSGGGPIGLLTARAANALGAAHVVVSEPTEVRRRLAVELGADAALNPAVDNFIDSCLPKVKADSTSFLKLPAPRRPFEAALLSRGAGQRSCRLAPSVATKSHCQ